MRFTLLSGNSTARRGRNAPEKVQGLILRRGGFLRWFAFFAERQNVADGMSGFLHAVHDRPSAVPQRAHCCSNEDYLDWRH